MTTEYEFTNVEYTHTTIEYAEGPVPLWHPRDLRDAEEGREDVSPAVLERGNPLAEAILHVFGEQGEFLKATIHVGGERRIKSIGVNLTVRL